LSESFEQAGESTPGLRRRGTLGVPCGEDFGDRLQPRWFLFGQGKRQSVSAATTRCDSLAACRSCSWILKFASSQPNTLESRLKVRNSSAAPSRSGPEKSSQLECGTAWISVPLCLGRVVEVQLIPFRLADDYSLVPIYVCRVSAR